MLRLPDVCTADQAIALIREDDARERGRLLAEYEPYEPSPDDRAWLAPQYLADEAEAWSDYREWAEAVEASVPITDLDLVAAGLAVG